MRCSGLFGAPGSGVWGSQDRLLGRTSWNAGGARAWVADGRRAVPRRNDERHWHSRALQSSENSGYVHTSHAPRGREDLIISLDVT